MTVAAAHTPPLGYSALTPVYDRVIAAITREKDWRKNLVDHIHAKPGETILDVGSGTGSLAVAVTRVEPNCVFRGIDPDADAVEIARRKAARAGSQASFEVGYFGVTPRPGEGALDKIVCSLVLHQVPLAEKARLLDAMFARLRPGGRLFIADYGWQPNLAMRLAFRATVQPLDGKEDTQPNAHGAIPELIEEAGFQDMKLLKSVTTPTGRIDVLSARKAGFRERVQ